jgi:hypothetical protein
VRCGIDEVAHLIVTRKLRQPHRARFQCFLHGGVQHSRPKRAHDTDDRISAALS